MKVTKINKVAGEEEAVIYEHITFEHVVALLKSQEQKELIESILPLYHDYVAALQEHGIKSGEAKVAKKLWNEAKRDNLSAIKPMGVFKTRKSEGVEKFNQIVHFDIDADDIAGKTVEQTFDTITKDPHLLMCFRSPSGDGLKLFFKTEGFTGSAQEAIDYYKLTAFPYLEEYLLKNYGQGVDEKCRDIARNCFLSYDPKVYYNPDCKPIAIPKRVEAPKPEIKPEKKPLIIKEYNDPSLEAIRATLSKVPSDDLDKWLKVGGVLYNMEPKGDLERKAIWDEWSYKCVEKFDQKNNDTQWNRYRSDPTREITWGSVKLWAGEVENRNDDEEGSGKSKNYRWVYDATIDSINNLGVQFRDGIIHHPKKPKCGPMDLVGEICVRRMEQNLRPISRREALDIIVDILAKQAAVRLTECRNRIKYDPNVPDRWIEWMKIVFKSEDDIDRMIMKHAIWIQKRRIFGLPVDCTHKPLFINLFGLGNTGKSSLLSKYLLKPIPEAYIKADSDVASIFNDERKYHNFGEHYAIKFGELGGLQKAQVEKLKNIIDEDKITSRVLGTNTNEKYYNNASLWGNSNKRICEQVPEYNPRKWYEFDMPARTQQEIDAYVLERDTIDPHDLYRCIDETAETTEMLTNWDVVKERIVERCGYVDTVLTFLADWFSEPERYQKLMTEPAVVSLQRILDNVNGGSNQIKHTNKSLAKLLRDTGFETKKQGDGQYVIITLPHITKLIKRVERVKSISATSRD